jgi:hypothetical protein
MRPLFQAVKGRVRQSWREGSYDAQNGGMRVAVASEGRACHAHSEGHVYRAR